jgi:hypothetical protein
MLRSTLTFTHMPYTLWSRGRQLGHTDLGFVQVYSNMRMGWFRPSEEGRKLMSVLTGTGPALHRVGKMMRNPRRVAMRRPEEEGGGWPRDIRATTAYADLVSSVDELEAMDLQLRDADGVVVQTQHIGVDDAEFKRRLIPKKLRRELQLDPEPWEREDEDRYQIQVYFPGPRRLLDEIKPR